jgi:hypothetical protein
MERAGVRVIPTSSLSIRAPITEAEIIDAARAACDSYWLGEDRTKRSVRADMTTLRALIRDRDEALAKAERSAGK